MTRNPVAALDLPGAKMRPAGYVVTQPNLWGRSVTRAYDKWLGRIPVEYNDEIEEGATPPPASFKRDRHCLAVQKHYRSLMPLAQEARKPIFHLRAADGALGAHASAAADAAKDFQELALRLAERIGLELPHRRARLSS